MSSTSKAAPTPCGRSPARKSARPFPTAYSMPPNWNWWICRRWNSSRVCSRAKYICPNAPRAPRRIFSAKPILTHCANCRCGSWLTTPPGTRRKFTAPARAAQNFFREANLNSLRELSLRLVADHVSVDTQEFHRTQAGAGAWKTGHRLMVGVSASPLSESLIRWTRRMTDSLQCPWLAVHVANARPLDEPAQSRLEKNLALARTLGAEVIDTADENLARGLLRIARQNNVSQIILGKPAAANLLEWFRAGKLLRQLTRDSGDIDLQVVRAEKSGVMPARARWRWRLQSGGKQYAVAAATLTAVGVFNVLLAQFTGPRVPGFIFLLALVLLAIFLGRGR